MPPRARGRFADGLFLAELGGLHDPGLLPHTVASCLGLPEQDARAQADAIVDYLHGCQLLLLLDSCEHLIAACADLAGLLLRYAAQVTVLATSRQPMNVLGEHCYPVPPLPARAVLIRAVLARAVLARAVLTRAVLAGAGTGTRWSCSPSGPRRPRPASPSPLVTGTT